MTRKRTRRPHIQYTDVQLKWIEEHSHLPRKDLHWLFSENWSEPVVTVDDIKSLCTRRGWRTGRDGRFGKGHVPANKGRKGNEHVTEKMRSTQFKKGQVPPNHKPLWHKRVNVYGYVEMKVPETNPYTGAKTRYKQAHHWLWEQKYGPMPKGHFLKCLDGNKTNIDLENWLCLPRSMQTRLNGIHGRDYDNAPEELKPIIMAACQLEQKLADLKDR